MPHGRIIQLNRGIIKSNFFNLFRASSCSGIYYRRSGASHGFATTAATNSYLAYFSPSRPRTTTNNLQTQGNLVTPCRTLISPSIINVQDLASMAPLTEESKKAIERLRNYKQTEKGPWDEIQPTRRAAVLLVLFADLKGERPINMHRIVQELRVVLTERSSSLRTFAGQVALPGGKADDASETPTHTARREAEEEIGLPAKASDLPPPFSVEHLCELPINLSRNNLGVVPCVAFLSGRGAATTAGGKVREANAEESLIPRLDPKEVASVFTAPFEAFLQANYEPPEFSSSIAGRGDGTDTVGAGSIDEEGGEGWYSGYWIDWHNNVRWKMHEFHVPARPVVSRLSSRATYEAPYPSKKGGGVHDRKLVRYRVWGLTARILVDAARIAYGREPEFECIEWFGDDDMVRELNKRGLMEERKRRGSKGGAGAGEDEESGRVKLMKEKAAGKL